MTSKLKTDVIETVSGSGTIALANQFSGMTHESVPALTSAHMSSGSVVQNIAMLGTLSNDTVMSGSTKIEIHTFDITTLANSKVILWMKFAQYLFSSSDGNLQLALSVDGVTYQVNTALVTDTNHISYGTGSSVRLDYNDFFITETLSAGTHTIKLLCSTHGTGTLTLHYQGRKNRYLAQEIKQ